MLDWSLDTGPGNLFLELVGLTTDRLSLPGGSYNFWTIDPSLHAGVVNGYFSTIVPPSGDVIVRIGGEGYSGSCNVFAKFSELEAVDLECTPTTVSYRLDFPYPIENVRSRRRLRPSSQRSTLPSRFRSAWLVGHDGVLKGDVPWIPAGSALTLPLNDGWEDVDDSGTVRSGWSRFMRHALRGGAFTFYPDKDDNAVSYPCVWADPSRGKPELEEDFTRNQVFGIRTTNGALIEGYSQ
jgi:hypothetical protein